MFEKVIAANSAIILLDTLAGWWVTQHNPETYHYLIDTSFIALAVLLGLAINFLLLRAAFAPLRKLQATIRAVEFGDLEARVVAGERDADVLMLARAFNAMLDRLAQARDDVAGRVLRAQEDERRRLALELHDQTGQSLTALSLHAQAIAQRLAGEPGGAATQARQHAERLAGLAQQTLAEVQALARQLRPAILDDLGLEAALRWLAEDAQERMGLPVQVRLRGELTSEGSAPNAAGANLRREPRAGDLETAIFRIAQESLTNAVRHGRARHVRLALEQAEHCVTLTVVDDGQGFNPHAPGNAQGAGPLRGGGLGLEGMRERARLVGGRLQVCSRPGWGSMVRVMVPCTGVPAPHDLLTEPARAAD
jgi:two-component system sensor histidine kinase UhpB